MDCNLLPLFELGSVQSAQYLLNIRLPSSSSQDESQTDGSEMTRNDLRRLKEINVFVSSCLATAVCLSICLSAFGLSMSLCVPAPDALSAY